TTVQLNLSNLGGIDAKFNVLEQNGGSTEVLLLAAASATQIQDSVIWLQGPAIPWLTEDPISGTVPAMNSTIIDVAVWATTDTITQTGVYAGYLVIQNDTPYGDLTIPVTMTVVTPAAGVMVDPDSAGVGNPGNTVSYTLWVTNTGTVPDTFDLAVSGESWPTTLSDSSVFLNPGFGTSVTIRVGIPAGTSEGSNDSATITATSQFDTNVFDSATVMTTTQFGYKIYLPIVDDS
ncbi:MAG: hypothetical protein ACE5GO_03510, partial [Anaerolineales bacterium]